MGVAGCTFWDFVQQSYETNGIIYDGDEQLDPGRVRFSNQGTSEHALTDTLVGVTDVAGLFRVLILSLGMVELVVVAFDDDGFFLLVVVLLSPKSPPAQPSRWVGKRFVSSVLQARM